MSRLRKLINILLLDIHRSLKQKILLTWLRVFLFKMYDRSNLSAEIAGFRMKFLDFATFSFLYNEIFINDEYRFKAETDHPFIIDCGSNIGMSVLYFKTLYPGSRIVAFEPGKETFACLEQNIIKNNLSDSVQIHELAVMDQEGSVEFFHDPENPGSLLMSTKKDRLPMQKRTVNGTVLSKHIDQEIDFLKMDIEGAETEVIAELARSGKLALIKQMAIEYHHHLVKDADALSKMLQLLEDAGFGYQIRGDVDRPFEPEQFQDIVIYAYRKRR
ncbi:FkbM family methyltransferase [Geomesophilobacter sediminis]|uniref:FkbM family methyltransferase n=1 Tax=Geomesophilobacter sediminis TaxID=2798584 RepID=A0A8J7LWG9_9BACT|nr:FkbM family methyltransferase [Geomesophilobacter sediminis]MBJ6725770.1 FkbM family methyltransferase [Geomesophilobacter sediminis]